jgi:hypothetical protein
VIGRHTIAPSAFVATQTSGQPLAGLFRLASVELVRSDREDL